MASIFSKIVAGEIPCYKIAEDNQFLAFLDINPLSKGHTLVIPKKETDYLFDIEDEELAKMIVFSKKVAIAIKKIIPCDRIGLTVIGLEVPHAHIHLIPINEMNDMNFASPKIKLEKSEFLYLAESIRGVFGTTH
ncbi:MAG: HIT domain-containing protein [Saprospiraceae bacterium]|nr:HIT domain-containing protein [Saprospiraceae bacterium]